MLFVCQEYAGLIGLGGFFITSAFCAFEVSTTDDDRGCIAGGSGESVMIRGFNRCA